MPGSSRVSVVVVSYNTLEKLRQCLLAVEPVHERIVVDNASADGSPDMVEREFPDVILIRNEANLGFGAANNLGSERATRPLTLFLNSDCYPEPGAIERLAAEMEPHDVVAAGGRLLHPDGRLQLSSANRLTLWAVFCEQTLLEKLFPRSRLFSPYWNSWRFNLAADVAQVMGACLMVRTGSALFDERFFLYVEDTELCRRLRELGRIRYVPEARFVHDLGSSTAKRWQAVSLYNRGKELYFRIHHSPLASAVCFALNRFGALLRLAAWGAPTLLTLGLVPRFRSKASLFLRVLFAPRAGR
jgi:N-acetylglucosaminyl-diphospho-decaprenol L-rhamnosyltransferase